MILTIDLSKKEPSLVLRDGNKKIASHDWTGLYQLSETLLPEIDKFLKENRVKLDQIEDIKIIPSKESLVSTRIAKATALGLMMKK